MPNWVTIKLEVSGPVDSLQEFKSCHVNDGYLDFNTIIPIPVVLVNTEESSLNRDQIMDNKRQYGFGSWYDAQSTLWGTKWNACDCSCSEEDEKVILEFKTAWNLPTKVLTELGNLYPELMFFLECVEEGGYFSGSIQLHEGNTVDGISDDEQEWRYYCKKLRGFDPYEDEDVQENPTDIPLLSH